MIKNNGLVVISNSEKKYSRKYFINREISWIAFNERVLEEAEDLSHPILERLKFLSIFSTNLDEFFMIRIAGLKEQIELSVINTSADEMSPQEQLLTISEKIRPLLKRHEETLMNDVMPKLAEAGITLYRYEELSDSEKERLKDYFLKEVLPVLTPLAIDPGHPFPHLLNRSLNLAYVLRNPKKHLTEDSFHFSVMQVPSVFTRFIKVSGDTRGHHFVLLEEIIQANANALFPGLVVQASFPFRVTRDADIELTEDDAEDLMKTMEEGVRRRKWGEAIRLEVSNKMPDDIRYILKISLEIEEDDIYETSAPINLSDFMYLHKIGRRELKDPPFNGCIAPAFKDKEESIFSAIRKSDILLHHPYDSFSNVIDFIVAAARDPKVMAIKQTLYRTGKDSPIVEALIKAAENGKQVTVILELKARFDEENNIVWAKRLEKAGIHVVYGLIGLKTHCKVTMVVRRDANGSPRIYLHIGTGNYNPSTAKLYTDLGLITADPDLGSDAINLFNYLTGYATDIKWKKLVMAPLNLRERTLRLISREMECHTEKKPGRIIAKMNSLVDEEIISALYDASNKGVKIDLIVRGICCLKPGIKGVSENIKVISIVGRLLEHSRIFYAENSGNEEIYIGSADMMPRNLDRRVEILVPITNPILKSQVKKILLTYLSDNTKARLLNSDGSYSKLFPKSNSNRINSQESFFISELKDPQSSSTRIVKSLVSRRID